MTRIAIVGAGHIGGNLARLFAAAGHAVTVSFATDRDKLDALAAEIGAAAGDPATARTRSPPSPASAARPPPAAAARSPWPGRIGGQDGAPGGLLFIHVDVAF